MGAEADLRETKNGLVPEGKGWFVLNARDSRWRDGGPLGTFCTFEGKQRFPQLGVNISVLQPGQPMAMYHREKAQESFLVLVGECLLVVEGEERRLAAWDLFYCPPKTNHVLIGAGDTAAVVAAVGARGRRGGGVVYPVCKAAARHRASVQHETRSVRDAYAEVNAGLPRSKWIPYANDWLAS